MRIDDHTIERIRQSADIADVIGDYVSLKKKGANLWACCPFHGEKSPSFSVSPAKGIYKCFGCGKAGDSIRFIMDIEGLGYGEALRHLAKKYGIEIQETVLTDEQQLAQNERESLLIVLNYAKNYFQDNLFKHEEGQSIGYPYFKERGFSDKTINTFELGYSLEGWDAFTKEALKNGYSLDILAKAGLTIVKEAEAPPASRGGAFESESDSKSNSKAPPSGAGGASRSFDRFRNRVTFPIHNVAGKVIAFGARILKADKSQAKYLNSPETEVYHKSNVLYGIFQAKNAIRTKDVCYLVEGYTDVISLHQAGIENVVASAGTSLTDEQIDLISKFTQNVIVLYDGDNAGIKAAFRGMDKILEKGLRVRVVTFPNGEDPDSYVRTVGEEDFLKYINTNSKDFVLFKAELSASEIEKEPSKKIEIYDSVIETLIKIPDLPTQSEYVERVSKILNIKDHVITFSVRDKIKAKYQEIQKDELRRTKEFLRKEIQEENSTQEVSESRSKLINFSTDSSELLQERECIRLLINHGTKEVDPGVAPGVTLMQYILAEIDGMNFETPIYQEILTIFREQFLLGNILNAQHFIGHRLANIQMEAINLSTERYSISEAWVKHDIIVPTEEDKLADLAFQNILRLKKAYNEQQMKGLMRQISQTKDIDEQTRLLEMFMQAKEIEKQIAKELGTVVK